MLTTVVNFVTAGVVVALCGSKMPDYITVNLSTAVAWIVAVIFAYITNKIFVFDSKTPNALAVVKELGAFLSARLLSLGYEAVWMNITVVYLHWYYFICKLIAQFVIVVLNYLFSKLFIFKKEKSK